MPIEDHAEAEAEEIFNPNNYPSMMYQEDSEEESKCKQLKTTIIRVTITSKLAETTYFLGRVLAEMQKTNMKQNLQKCKSWQKFSSSSLKSINR